MTKTQLITIFTLFLIAIACKDFNSVECELEEIKKVGDREPFVALAKYDSLQGQIGSASEYIRNKYALLGLRLRDKALLLHTSDSCIRRLVPYFEKKGTVREKQEVYYYAGSVYRDLKDTPRSLEYFLLSAECADKGEADSVLLRNCYSQLYGLFFNVQDYIHALEYARKECVTAEKVGILDDISLMHMANAYVRVDSCKEALMIARDVLEIDKKMSPSVRNADLLYSLLYMFCSAREKECAQECLNIIRQDNYGHENEGNRLLSMAEYYRCMGLTDSCIQCFQLAVDKGDTLCRYDASRNLFYLCDRLGYKDTAYKYASEYVDVSSNYDLGRRQELAATANNQYQYYKEKREEEQLREENEKIRMRQWISVLAIVVAVFLMSVILLYRKNKRIVSLNAIYDSFVIQDGKRVPDSEQRKIDEILKNVRKFRMEWEETKHGLLHAEQEIHRKEKLLEESSAESLELRKELESAKQTMKQISLEAQEKMQMGAELMREACKMEIQKNYGDMVSVVEDAINNGRKLTNEEWLHFMTSINQEYPFFNQSIILRCGVSRKEQKKAYYLFVAGFTPSQISSLMHVSRTTIYRWHDRFLKSWECLG